MCSDIPHSLTVHCVCKNYLSIKNDGHRNLVVPINVFIKVQKPSL